MNAQGTVPQNAPNIGHEHINQGSDIDTVKDFLLQFCRALLYTGAHTERVNRNAVRTAAALGYQACVAFFPKHMMLSLSSTDGREQRMVMISFTYGASDFRKLTAIVALGWSIVDARVSLQEANIRLKAILSELPYPPACVHFMVACANAAFCRLFEGDAIAMAMVFMATLVGFYVRQRLVRWQVNSKVVFFCCAFIASLLTTPGILFHWGSTPQIALAVSVLFLIPGIPLINALLDLLEGRVLMGFSRFVQASMHIVCIALGLALTMSLLSVSAL